METVVYLGKCGVLDKYKTESRLSYHCNIEKPHIVITDVVYTSSKAKGSYALCPVHNEFFIVSETEEK